MMRLDRLVLALAALLSAPALAQDGAEQVDENFERRWESLAAGGYQPLTIPVDWYDPIAEVAGDPKPYSLTTPQAAGIATTSIASADAWAKSQNSTALIIARDGKVVHERYWQGSGRDTLFNPQSMSKTLTAMLVGTAIARGEIASVNDPIGKYISEWADDPRGQIPLRHMLWMASGLEQGDDGYGYQVTRDNPIVRHSLGSDFTKRLLTLNQRGSSGETFDYNNQVNQLVGMVLEGATGKDYEILLSERLWQPLGLADAKMPLDREGGMVLSSCCVISRPIDWVRIGGVFVDAEKVGARQIISREWLAEMAEPSPGYAGYGFQVWTGNQQIGGERPPGVPLIPWQSEAFAAPKVIVFHGHGGQRTYVLPDKGLVIVRAARDWPDAWDDALLPNVIWRGTSAQKGITE
ncbi:serine hydrolase domain-containing protein [Altererythrobacter lutimaris]|uniref:Serine hydrolase n=1 Tax=Altererythrobacter lutimaris TaxID=2743979 RepID=A0A850HDF3_9SPHN|nr:serine hydrolase [Altererythrobacter lutimaris]NVE95650.1 serine hydrolase [Altererythrobacter lutimaris]